MTILRRLFGKPDPMDVHRMPTNPEDFIRELSRRPQWRKIDIHLLQNVLHNSSLLCDPLHLPGYAGGEMELLRNFVFVSEKSGTIEKLVNQATNPEIMFGSPLAQYALTLHSLGMNLCRQIPVTFVNNPDQTQGMEMMADFAFTSSILCDPLHLPGYAGMAFLYGIVVVRKKVGLEWCQNYIDAERRLLNTSDDKLSDFNKVQKGSIEDPESEKIYMALAAKALPHLFTQNSNDYQATGDTIRRLQIELSAMPDPPSASPVPS